MSELTLQEKSDYAAQAARLLTAEKHFFDLAQPHYPKGFSVHYRNPGHWDVYADQVPGKASAWNHANPDGRTTARDGGRERAFRIRGEPQEVIVHDERWDPHRPAPREPGRFQGIMSAMIWISEELMQEPRDT